MSLKRLNDVGYLHTMLLSSIVILQGALVNSTHDALVDGAAGISCFMR